MTDRLIPENVWEELEQEGYGIRGDYSGRGMFGEKCAGFTTGDPFSLGVDLALRMGEDAKKLIRKARTDSMGLDTIVYFPSYKLEGWEPEKDDWNEDDGDEEDEEDDDE